LVAIGAWFIGSFESVSVNGIEIKKGRRRRKGGGSSSSIIIIIIIISSSSSSSSNSNCRGHDVT
jgi:hypothetical protein